LNTEGGSGNTEIRAHPRKCQSIIAESKAVDFEVAALESQNTMAAHSRILAAGGQNKICRRADFFLERHLFVTRDLVRLLLIEEVRHCCSNI
jgi:hypothetical protein